MPAPSASELAWQMSTLIDRWRTYTDQMKNWLGGTADGGPNHDGKYPLTDALGTTYMVLCPAGQEAQVETNATSAGAKATDAVNAANAAAASAASAVSARDVAMTFAESAQAARDMAQTYMNAAGTSAANALLSETHAKTSETTASSAAESATTSKNAAATSETNAKTSETSAAASAASALSSKNAAATSETSALASKNAAATSETNAKTSETNSAASAASALASKNSASTSETNALASKNAAKTSETNAKTSETNAATSEANALSYKNAAAASAAAAATFDPANFYTKTAADGRFALKATTVSGYGITDAYTKAQTDAADATKANLAGANTFTGPQQIGPAGTNGYLRLNPGDVNQAGYIEFFTKDSVRRGYLGYASGNNLNFALENGWGLNFTQRPSFNGATPWDSANLANPATLDTIQTITGTKYFTGGVRVNYQDIFTGAVGTQQILQGFGFNNNINRWKVVLEGDASYSLYAYDTAGGTPTQMFNLRTGVTGGTENISAFYGKVVATGGTCGFVFQGRSDASKQFQWYSPDGNVANLYSSVLGGTAVSVSGGGVFSATGNISTSAQLQGGSAAVSGSGAAYWMSDRSTNRQWALYPAADTVFLWNGSANTIGITPTGEVYTASGGSSGQPNCFTCQNWFRSLGSTGWYNQTHNVGIYATEGGNVRTYNNANLIAAGGHRCLTTTSDDIFYVQKITQANYNALSSKDANTLYVIVG